MELCPLLPDLLIEIFSYLPQTDKQKLYKVSSHPSWREDIWLAPKLWRYVSFTYYDNSSDYQEKKADFPEFLSLIPHTHSHIQELNLDEYQFKDIIETNPELEFERLKSFKIHINGKSMNARILCKNIIRAFPMLDDIHLLILDFVGADASFFRCLSALRLKKLTLFNCRHYRREVKYFDESVRHILTSQPDLTELSLFTYDKMESLTLHYVFKYCRMLKMFSFSAPAGLSNDVFEPAFTPLLLEKVKLASCNEIDNNFLLNLGKRSQNLTSFTIYQCNEVTSQGIMHLTQFCPELHEIAIEYYYSDPLGSEGLCYIWKSCRELRKFKYRQAVDITDSDMVSFAQACVQLRELTLYDCPLMSDIALVEIARCCKLLTVVELWHSKAITLFGVLTMILEAKQLKKLILDGSARVLDIPELGTEPEVGDTSWESSVIRSARKRMQENVGKINMQHSSPLTRLYIESEKCNAKFDTVLSIAKLCPNIRKLSIPRFFFGGLSKACYKQLKSLCKVLESVSLEMQYIEV